MFENFKNYITLMRVKQYLKNFFIFMPLFFAVQITNIALLIDTIIVFIFFSFSASFIYILNDYIDIENDKKHPIKRDRPLASGKVSKKEAIYLGLLNLLLSLVGIYLLSISAFLVTILYLIINLFYIFIVKHIAILDIVTISLGFVLRLFIGATVGGIELSMWVVVMTFLLALLLILAKRRDDVLIFNKTGVKTRQVIDGYNLKFVDFSMGIMAAVIIIGYILYTITHASTYGIGSSNLYLTSIFVIVGIMRYMQITFVYEDSGSPTKIIIKDLFTQINIIMWMLSFILILY